MSARYYVTRPDGSESGGVTRAEVEREFAAAAQDYADQDDWGTVVDEDGNRCRIVMGAWIEGQVIDRCCPTCGEEFR